MDVRRAIEADRMKLAELAARQQAYPERHCAYLGSDAATIAAEMVEEDDDWTAATAVAEDGGAFVGWLMGSFDVEMGRVWWFGPFIEADDAAWPAMADALFAHARSLLLSSVNEEECAPDSRFELLERWALADGFTADPGSAALVLDAPLEPATIETRSTTGADAATVGRLHDELFAGAHLNGERVVGGNDDSHIRLVAELDGEVLGYIAVEVQPDDTGYIDFLGVAPDRRRQGLGAQLIRAGVAALRERGVGGLISLTVREENVAARALYTGLGFTEERVIHPFRKGFTMA